MIHIKSVFFKYESNIPVIHNNNLCVKSGLTLLLGPNGSGKSTILKLTAGVEKPESGQIFIDEYDLWKNEIQARKNLVYVPEHPDLTPYATLQEIFTLVCRLRGESLQAGEKALERFGLASLSGRTIRRLSKGERRRAVFAAALIGLPRNILLDEPLEGMDRNISGLILDWIKTRVQDGALVIVASHLLEPFFDLVDSVIAMQKGEATLHKNLPSDSAKKQIFLETLARGKGIKPEG